MATGSSGPGGVPRSVMRDPMTGRLIRGGGSLNPGGRPPSSLASRLRKRMRTPQGESDTDAIFEEVLRLARGESKEHRTVGRDGKEQVEQLVPRAGDTIEAARLVLRWHDGERPAPILESTDEERPRTDIGTVGTEAKRELVLGLAADFGCTVAELPEMLRAAKEARDARIQADIEAEGGEPSEGSNGHAIT